MGMSIDDAIETLLDTNTYGTADIAKRVAIDTMLKYQKIEQIFKDIKECELVGDFALDEIREVIEGGNDD